MLSVAKVYAGRGAVNYYLSQARRGLADYYLPDGSETSRDDPGAALAAPGSAWWGGGAEALGLDGPVTREAFEPLYAAGLAPDGGPLGRRFRTGEQAAEAKQADLTATDAIQDPHERWTARHGVRRAGSKASVAGWDCVFSPVKSVSVLWAAGTRELQQQVWQAHQAAVEAALAYLQQHGAYVRAGRNGVRVLDSTGLVVARMNEWTSRDGDMQLHTHCLVLNRARTAEDGQWRALDGRTLLAARTGASSFYDRVLEAELTRRLGVAWRDRADGLREIDGINEKLLTAFSTRRQAITRRVDELVADFEQRYGIAPNPSTVAALAQQATWQTRKSKHEPTPAAAVRRWARIAEQHGQPLAQLPRRATDRKPRNLDPVGAVDRRLDDLVLHRLLEDGRTSFDRYQLLRAALDVLPPAGHTPTSLQAAANQLVDRLTTDPRLLSITPPDVLDPPAELTRADGTSIYVRPDRGRWTLWPVLDREAWLLDVADEPTPASPLPGEIIEATNAQRLLGDDQAHVARQLLAHTRRLSLLVGPAGAGKTHTLRAVVDAHTAVGRPVVGLSVSQSAAEVLSELGGLRAENTTKWLLESRAGRWHLPTGALLLIDEASMLATDQLVELVEQARHAGGRVLLVGDPAQLPAIGTGGAFSLLADRLGAVQLAEVRRFTEPWQAMASLQLRDRDPAAIAAYAMRARIHGHDSEQIADRLFAAWCDDALTPDEAGRPRQVAMIVGTNSQAADLARRARAALQDAGHVHSGPTVQLSDNSASVGDRIVTRRNHRGLHDTHGRWVVNGDSWIIVDVHLDGAATVQRERDGTTLQLPADYLATHSQLAYATTAHRAQGTTVDTAHALVGPETGHDQLYVAATRGRNANHLWVACDPPRGMPDPPDPEQVLAGILRRRAPGRLAAHHALEDAHHEVTSLARLGAVYEDAATHATSTWLQRALIDHGLEHAVDEPSWPALVTRCRSAALAGHDLPDLINAAVRLAPLDDAYSGAALLHWRLGLLAEQASRVRMPGPTSSIPPVDGPHAEIAAQAHEQILQRTRALRDHYATGARTPPSWAADLGPRPLDPTGADDWLQALACTDAYRQRYELDSHVPMLGPRPSSNRPDAQYLHDEAQRHVDGLLARRIERLSPQERDALAARQQAVLDARPDFDPEELEQAHRDLQATRGGWVTAITGRRPDPAEKARLQDRIARLEGQATAHEQWRIHAERARRILTGLETLRHRSRETRVLRR